MTRLNWSDTSKRVVETGLDRGVLYPNALPPGPIAATNDIFDPSTADGTLAPWATYGADTTTTSVVEDGKPAMKVVKTANTTSMGASTLGLTNKVAGTVVTISAEVKNPVGTTVLPVAFIARDDPNNDSAVLVSVTGGALSTSVPADGQWHRIFVTGSIKAARNLTHLYIYKAGAVPSGEILYIRNVMMNDGVILNDFFDGDTTTPDNSLYSYAWTGVPYASTSTKRQVISNVAAWEGLTSVDENGAESAVAYYVDGRPFLFVPKPKEFSATLKAYTYPDEFAAIMGQAEAADGMYLDSQQGDSFCLSYRTQIGNALEGLDYGYKIHLIYNATVAPAGVGYASLSQSINPSELSWEIQAVPVKVAGYRPTAHITIDTRHMDPAKLAEIEDLLYGTSTTNPIMPDAQTLLDILSYGDAIVITDNGDGTWTAEGSYHNIYMIGDGIFEIDNVTATDNGDGTYYVSSTP